jgi:hypothetical protein
MFWGNFIKWLNENQGLQAAIAILITIFSIIFGKVSSLNKKKQIQKSGKNSKNFQAGNNIVLNNYENQE